MKNIIETIEHLINKYKSDIDKLEAENARYREALKFYADPWRSDEELDADIGPWGGEEETGHIARKALNQTDL